MICGRKFVMIEKSVLSVPAVVHILDDASLLSIAFNLSSWFTKLVRRKHGRKKLFTG